MVAWSSFASSPEGARMAGMIQCPVCHSAEVQSNRFENLSFDDVAGGALAARRSGHPAHAFSLLLVWAAVEGANCLRAGWRCQHCGHQFR